MVASPPKGAIARLLISLGWGHCSRGATHECSNGWNSTSLLRALSIPIALSQRAGIQPCIRTVAGRTMSARVRSLTELSDPRSRRIPMPISVTPCIRAVGRRGGVASSGPATWSEPYQTVAERYSDPAEPRAPCQPSRCPASQSSPRDGIVMRSPAWRADKSGSRAILATLRDHAARYPSIRRGRC